MFFDKQIKQFSNVTFKINLSFGPQASKMINKLVTQSSNFTSFYLGVIGAFDLQL